jgi:RHS repeat-associated protein
VRQQFVGYERDNETGLDYAGARYFASVQGRFTSPDPLLGSGEVADPQTWNRYNYSLNNPLRYTDPTGLYVFDSHVDEEQRKAFRAALTKAGEALKGYKEGSKEYNKIKRSLDAYGKEGIDNGVTVMAAKLTNDAETQVAGSLGKKTADNPTGQQIRVTLNTDFFNSKTDAAELSITAAHEGSHIADGSEWVGSGFANGKNPTRYQTEMTAWTVAGMVAQHFNIERGYAGTIPVPGHRYGLPTVYYVWNRGWAGADAAVIEANRTKDIEGYFNTPPNQGGNAFPGGKGSDKAFNKNSRFRK